MNSETGEIRTFEGEIPKGWVQLRIGEKVYVLGCHFEIIEVNSQDNTVILKGIPSIEARIAELSERVKPIVQPGAFGKHHKETNP